MGVREIKSELGTHDITIEELRKAKDALECDLLKYVCDRIKEFKKVTNYCPSSIEIDMYDATCIADKSKQFEVNDVKVTVEIF